MDPQTKEIIAKQTGQEDLVVIEKTFYECQGDIGATICKLQNIPCEQKTKPYTKFDEMREILAEKDKLFDIVRKKVSQ